ncbi:MAG: arsenite methyltransferase [Myxococcota bacterium]
MSDADVRTLVQRLYGARAQDPTAPLPNTAHVLGYSKEDTANAEAANLGLGCGNPTALAELTAGDVVIDLGSGSGFDALVAAPKLGEEGRFIGVDMTVEMLEKARAHAVEAGFARTLEFREGQIEALPVTDARADVVISNCVINLSTDKAQVFREAFRVLKPGGRLAVSDIVLSAPLPAGLSDMAASWLTCIGGASSEAEYLGYIRAAGFVDVSFTRTPAASLLEGFLSDPIVQTAVQTFGSEAIERVADTVFSYAIRARKP